MRYHRDMRRSGITLIEIVIAVALLAILGGVVLVAINPFGQVAGARNTQRELHLQALMNGIRQNIGESGTNSFTCVTGAIPAAPTRMRATGGYDIAPCLVPAFLPALPYDPTASGTGYASVTSYDTGYSVSRSATSGQVTLTAPFAELGKTVTLVR